MDKKAEAETLQGIGPNILATEQNKDTTKFSFFKQPVTNLYPFTNCTLQDVCDLIKGQIYKTTTEKLRAISDEKAQDKYKKNYFDYVTFSGTFSERGDTKVLQRSDWFHIDIDHLSDLQATRNTILLNFKPALMFVSPRGNGLKIVYKIDTTAGTHEQYYIAFENYFADYFGVKIDFHCKNISRACFLPYDPDIYYNITPDILDISFLDTFLNTDYYPEKTDPVNEIIKTGDFETIKTEALNLIIEAVDHEKHGKLLRASRVFGRLISGKQITENDAIKLLEEEIQKKPINNFKTAQRTIRDGIAYGKPYPLRPLQTKDEHTNKPENLLIVKTVNEWIKEAKLQKIPEKLFGEFWFESEIAILFASSGVGKTLLAYQVSDAITKAKKCLTFNPEYTPKKVVYCDFELSAKQIESRYSANYTNHFDFSENFFRVEINTDADIDPTRFEELIISELERTLNETGAKILIVDNITYFRDEQEKAKDALKLMKQLKALKNRLGLSILILAHTPKRDGTKAITRNDISGSSMIVNFTDSAFTIGESSQDGCYRYLKQVKPGRFCSTKYDADNVIVCSISNPENFTRFEFVEYGSESDHLKTKEGKPRNERDNEIMKMHKSGLSLRDISDKMQLSHTQVSKIINTMKTNDQY